MSNEIKITVNIDPLDPGKAILQLGRAIGMYAGYTQERAWVELAVMWLSDNGFSEDLDMTAHWGQAYNDLCVAVSKWEKTLPRKAKK